MGLLDGCQVERRMPGREDWTLVASEGGGLALGDVLAGLGNDDKITTA